MTLVAAAAWAQDAPQTGAAGEAAQPVLLGPVSTTATRNPIEAFDYPGMVTVVEGEELKLLQPSTPDDMLKMVPNVQFTGGPRRTGETPSVRGFSGSDLVILLDGARQNFLSGHDGRFFLDPMLFREVEVLRGPASSLYGSGGNGGVIEFRTVDAADLLEEGERYGVSFSVGHQTVNEEWLGATTAYATPVDGVDLIGSVVKRNSGDIRLGDGSEITTSEDDILSGLVKGSVKLGDHHRIEASYIRFSNDAEEPNNGQGAGSEGLVDKEISTDTWRLAYAYRDPANNLIDLDIVAYYTDFRADELRLDSAGAGPQGELLKRDVETLGLRIDNRSRFALSDSVSTVFTYGVEAYGDRQDGAAGGGDRQGVPDADTDFFGAFAQAEVSVQEPFGFVTGEVLVIPGLRYDRYHASSEVADSNDDEAVSPRVGVTYMPTEWLMFFGSWSEAFRAPAVDELYLTGTHFVIPGLMPGWPDTVNRFVPNPDLKPQRTETWEFGAGLHFRDVLAGGDRLQVKASHFMIDGTDFIDFQVNQPAFFIDCMPMIPGDCDGTTELINVPSAELEGTEVEAWYESDRFRLGFSYSTIDGENTDTGEKLGILTPDMYKVDAAVKVPDIDAIIGWRVIAAEHFDRVDTDAEEREAYVVNDIYAAWAPSEGALKGLRLDVGIDNVFDETYARVYNGVVEPGVNYKAMVSYSLTW